MTETTGIKTKVISQTHSVYEGVALSITVPAATGEMVILPNHMDLVALLVHGLVHITEANSKAIIIVNGGLLQVKKNEVTILSDEAVLPEELVLQEIETAIENAKNQLTTPLSETELVQLEKQLKFEMFKKKFKETN